MKVEIVRWSCRPTDDVTGEYDENLVDSWRRKYCELVIRLRQSLLRYDGDIVDMPHNLLAVTRDMRSRCPEQQRWRSWWLMQADVFRETGMLFSESTCRHVWHSLSEEGEEG